MVYKKLYKILNPVVRSLYYWVKIGVLLILILSSFSGFIKTSQACTVASPLQCAGGTAYDCGFYRYNPGKWICGIKMTPDSYYCSNTWSATDTPECSNVDVWFKQNACPNTGAHNGDVCIFADGKQDCLAVVHCHGKTGKWNAQDKACVQCSGKTRSKLLADTTQKCYDYRTIVGIPCHQEWHEFACVNNFAGKCDYGCGADLECNHADNAAGVIVPGGVCNNCVFTGCSCGAWVNDACGAAGCAANQMHQTRSCNPPGCDVESQCVNDSCTPWVDDACGPAGGCALGEMHQTRSCTYHCLSESRCVPDPVCCTCTPWVNDVCGGGTCAANQMHQTRSCNPPGCDVESQCVNDSCTPWENDACGVAGCGPLEMHQTRSCTFGCESETRCVDDPKCGVVFINPLEAGSIPEVIAAIGDWIFIIGLGLVVLMDIIGGVILITSGGDPNKIATAKRIFFFKAIGAAVVILSKGVSGIIRYILGIK